MSSARSVSHAVMPRSARASLSPISCVAMDFTLTTSVEPVARTRSPTIVLASAASRAQWTTPPLAVTVSSSCPSSSGSRAIVSALIACPASRSASQSGTSATTAARFSRIVRVALPRLARSWVSASALRAAAGKRSTPSMWPVARSAWTTGRGIPMNVLTASSSRRLNGAVRRGQDLGEVQSPRADVKPAEAAADVHQAG